MKKEKRIPNYLHSNDNATSFQVFWFEFSNMGNINPCQLDSFFFSSTFSLLFLISFAIFLRFSIDVFVQEFTSRFSINSFLFGSVFVFYFDILPFRRSKNRYTLIPNKISKRKFNAKTRLWIWMLCIRFCFSIPP